MKFLLQTSIGCLLIVLGTTISYAQSDKTTVGILPFSYVNTGSVEQYVETINELVESAFVNANRQIVVSRTEFNELKQEIERNKGSEFIDGKAVNQGRQMGAQYLVKGRVLGAGKSVEKTTSGTTYNAAKIDLSVKVIDVETGQVVASQVLHGTASDGRASNISDGLGGGSLLSTILKTTEGTVINKGGTSDIMTAASESLSSTVYKWVSERFVAKLSIVKILEQDDRKGAQTILIAGGSSLGLRSGSRLKVVEMEELEVDGKTEVREIEVAQLKVDKVEGEKFSNCKVTDGGKELLLKFNAKTKLKALTVR